MTGIEELEFVLPRDVVICPVQKLTPEVRRQIASDGTEFAISRPHLRIPSKLIDGETASLLSEFDKPTSIVDAVARFSKGSSVDAVETLESSFDALRALIAGQILIPQSTLEETPKATLVPGMVFVDREIVRVLQALEDCAVYEALDTDGRTVAIKVVPASAPELAHRMLQHEGHALRILNGVPSPALLAEGEVEGDRYLVLEWIAGRDIASEAARLRLGGMAQRPALFELCLRTLRCYAGLHEAGVIHGDVHPGNILVSPGGEVRLLDFGRCASRWIETEPVPRAGVGQYYDPELAKAVAAQELPPQPNERGEQYAVAALLYQLLTGRTYTDFSLEKDVLLRQVIEAQPVPFARVGTEPWPDVETALFRALQKNPIRRFPSVAEFATRFSLAAIPRPECPREANPILNIRDEQPLATIEAAWFLLRAATIREDAELLAMADVSAENAATASDAPAVLHYIRARIAHARSDSHSRAMNDFCQRLPSIPSSAEMSAICWFLAQGSANPRLTSRAETYLHSFVPQDSSSKASVAWLRVALCVGMAATQQLIGILHEIAEKEKRQDVSITPADGIQRVSFWSLADELAPCDDFRRAGEHVALACFHAEKDDRGKRSGAAARGFALLHWYRHTGDPRWLSRAAILARRAPAEDRMLRFSLGLNDCNLGALFQLEMEKPELSELPPEGLYPIHGS